MAKYPEERNLRERASFDSQFEGIVLPVEQGSRSVRQLPTVSPVRKKKGKHACLFSTSDTVWNPSPGNGATQSGWFPPPCLANEDNPHEVECRAEQVDS